MDAGIPSVSLVIPCHNQGSTLGRAVASSLRQRCLGEIIVVDDFSVDDSLAIALEIATRSQLVTVLPLGSNGGPGVARNAGVRAAKYPYVCFLDADDELLGDLLFEAVDIMTKQPNIRAVKPDEEFFDPIKGYFLPVEDPRHSAAVQYAIHGLVMERDVFMRMGGFPEDSGFLGARGGEDIAFMQALFKYVPPVGFIPEPRYRLWNRSGSHIDRFLGSTRLTGNSFEFVRIDADQLPGSALARAMDHYVAEVGLRLSAS